MHAGRKIKWGVPKAKSAVGLPGGYVAKDQDQKKQLTRRLTTDIIPQRSFVLVAQASRCCIMRVSASVMFKKY